MPRMELPPEFVVQAREYVDGTREPAEPRDAATVVLLRPGAEEPLIYLLRRHVTMEFAGGMCVFPGGSVDPRDFDSDVAWVGPSPNEWAAQLGTNEETARALVCAAVRETFEESGVLLAGETPDSVIVDTTADDWERDRAALEAHELAFTDFLNRRRLMLRTDLLGVWSGWLTPVFEPRRYRTWFFVAALPEGQRTRDVSSESDLVAWLPALRAVEESKAQTILMLPPTHLTCLEIGQYDAPSAVLAAAVGRSIEMFTPQVEETATGGTLSIPPRYERLLGTQP